MKASVFLPNCIMILFLAGGAVLAPQTIVPPAYYTGATATPEIPPAGTQQAATAAEPSAAIDVAGRIRENLLTDLPQLRLVGMASAIFLYPEPTTKSTKIKLRNESVQGISELIVLKEVTSPEGAAFYQVRSTFGGEPGYILVRDAKESRLAGKGTPGYARIEAAACNLLAKAQEDARVLASECEHLVRILGELDGYYYVLTEAGNYGFVLPAQLVRISPSEVSERIARAESEAVRESMRDSMTQASAANTAKMLRAGADSAAVHYWTTAEAHVAQQGKLKKAAIAMLRCTAGDETAPVGYQGIQFRSCPEVPMMRQGEVLERGLDFNLHGSIYSDSPLTSVTAEMTPLAEDGSVIRETVPLLPEENVTAYSLTTKAYESLDKQFDVRRMRPGPYHFTLSATSVSHPDPVSLVSVDCSVVMVRPHTLSQNKFDDNYLDALEFFRGDKNAFLFPFYMGDGRGIGTDETWRNAHIVASSMGRVNVFAVPNFERANHYLKNTYIRVSLLNRRTNEIVPGETMLLDTLVDKYCAYVPRFQSNLEYLSHHTLGTAIDVNDNMYPNTNTKSNHDLIGSEVRNNLAYNGIKTDENGIRYYDFSYTGSYPARYQKVPKTIINYLIYELAFFRAGFEWGFYYETTCDAMHFMLTENDINRHMHSDIGLRKVFDYIEPEWTYVPTPTPSPAPSPTPKPTRAPKATPTPAPTPTPTK